jgi:hypothetical protein
MAIAGFVRSRAHQFGRQASLGTKVAAARRYPFKGVPSNNLNWTDPDVDEGSIDPVSAPYRQAPDLTASLTDPSVRYNNLPLMLCATFGGDVDSTGTTAQTWVYAPASDGTDEPDVFTYEFGDDVTDDWFQLGDGIIETLEITGPDGLGALTASQTWRFGSIASSGSTDSPASPSVPTGSLAVPTDDIVVYLKDGQIAIASDPGDLSTSQVSDALHTFTLRITKTVDQKRFANGAQSFDITAYGVGARSIELECTFAKTSDIVGTSSESDAWMSDQAVNRFVQISFESLANAATGPDVPYSWVFAMPMRYYTRTEGEIGGNTTVVLTGHAFLDPDGSDTDFGGVFTSTLVNTLDSDDL